MLINNDSLFIVLSNIKLLQSKNNLTLKALSKKTNIPESTISSWYTTRRKRRIYPRLKTLDKLCDAFEIHTSDLFMENPDFKHPWLSQNDSMNAYKCNFLSLCNEKGYTTVQSRIDHIFSTGYDPNSTNSAKELYYSYLRERNGRSVTLKQLDIIANKLNVYTYKLII